MKKPLSLSITILSLLFSLCSCNDNPYFINEMDIQSVINDHIVKTNELEKIEMNELKDIQVNDNGYEKYLFQIAKIKNVPYFYSNEVIYSRNDEKNEFFINILDNQNIKNILNNYLGFNNHPTDVPYLTSIHKNDSSNYKRKEGFVSAIDEDEQLAKQIFSEYKQKLNDNKAFSFKWPTNNSYIEGNKYRLVILDDINIYAVVTRTNHETSEQTANGYYVFYSYLLSSNNFKLSLEESDSSFTYSYDAFTFDEDAAIEDISNNKYQVTRQSGTEEEPYLLSKPDDFSMIYNKPNAHYKLVNSIDFNGQSVPSFDLNGAIDGDGYTIKNFKKEVADSNRGGEELGFIRHNNGVLKNVIFDNCSVKISGKIPEESIAGIACATNYGTIENVIVKNSSVYSDTGSQSGKDSTTYRGFAGGISGISYGLITRCGSVNNNVYAWASSKNYNWPFDSKDGASYAYAGGIAGDASGTISNCYSRRHAGGKKIEARVNGAGLYPHAGGLCGQAHDLNLINSISYGNLISCERSDGKNIDRIGSIFGFGYSTVTISKTYSEASDLLFGASQSYSGAYKLASNKKMIIANLQAGSGGFDLSEWVDSNDGPVINYAWK